MLGVKLTWGVNEDIFMQVNILDSPFSDSDIFAKRNDSSKEIFCRS
jgi:hypothetical protein